MKIIELSREKYQHYQLVFTYEAKAYYDVRMRTSENVFSLEMVKTPCKPEKKEFVDYLFAPHWDDPHVYGLFDGATMLAIMEVTPENWNNRFRITNLLVREGYRRRGLGSLMITKAKELARSQRRRALILETQSCNVAAIAFYQQCGLSIMGFNACEYSNEDIARHEVRIEMGCLL